MENPYIQKQISTSVEIVRSYLFDKPFHVYLKEVFRNHKQWGSKDRRNYKKYCYLILKNAGTLGEYFRVEFSNFSEDWKIHFGELPAYYWPICLFNPDSISKLNLVALNYLQLRKGLSNESESEPNGYYEDNSLINSIKSFNSTRNKNIDPFNINGITNTTNWIEEKLEELEFKKSYSIIVSHFNNAIIDWVLELEKGKFIWEAYDALQFCMNQTKEDSFDFSSINSKNRKTLGGNSISKDIEVSVLNQWFQHEAPVFYLDKNTGINQEFAPNSAVNEWVDRGLGIIQDRSSTVSIQYLLEYISKQIVYVAEDSLKFNLSSANPEIKYFETDLRISDQELNNGENKFHVTNQGLKGSKSELEISSNRELNIPQKEEIQQTLKVWDCCSGAGGKSLSFQIQFEHYIKPVNPIIKQILFQSNWICTDVRQTIIDNLKKRFKLLNLIQPNAIQLNLLDKTLECYESNILESNLIIADLPCSGSGTWRRTAEELLKAISVDDFALRQYRIVENIMKIKSNASNNNPYYIYYMTCSVFALENENNIKLLLNNHSKLECVWQNFFGGYSENADFIYGALLKVN